MTNPTIDFENLKIDAFQFAVQGSLLLATRGAGKTTAFKFIAESLMDVNVPVIIIDPVGKSRYLKFPNPNNIGGKSYPVIVVGKDGDVVLSADTIEDVIRVALQTRSSVVVDLFDIEIMDQWDEIVTKIVKLLLFENGLYGLRSIIFEEASEFVHQQGKKTQASEWIERLVRYSGNCKVGVILVNQNSESLSKNVVKLCDGRILGRQTEINTIETIRKSLSKAGIENTNEIVESLPSLQSGEFWVWQGASNHLVKAKIPDIKSLHPSRNSMNAQDTQAGDSIDSVLERMSVLTPNIQGEISIDDYVLYTTQTLNNEYPEIDISYDESKLNFIDKHTINRAKSTPYGSNTVKETIDELISHGYTIFHPVFRYIECQYTGKHFGLSGSVEYNYAKFLIGKLQ